MNMRHLRLLVKSVVSASFWQNLCAAHFLSWGELMIYW